MTERKFRIWIKSFFIDYYDHHFNGRFEANEIWHRKGNLPPYRSEALKRMQRLGLPVPRHGTVADLLGKLSADAQVVLYTDVTKHTAAGKELRVLSDIPEHLHTYYASEYVHPETPAVSSRVLWAGDRAFSYTMQSDHEWMSNTGHNIQISEVQERTDLERHFAYPLYAIDFVGEYAVDLNRCPGVRHTGVDDLVDAKDFADAILDYAQTYDFSGDLRA